MSKARAELSLAQVQTLLEGRPITIRLPEQRRVAVAFAVAQPTGKPDVTHIIPGIEVEITREPLRDQTITVTVTNTRRPKDSRIDRLFNDFDRFFKDLGGFFRL